MYTPLRQLVGNLPMGRVTGETTLMAKRGEDLRDAPQLLNTEYALKISNYLINTDGRLTKRKGLVEFLTVAGTTPITLLDQYTDDLVIFGYGVNTAIYRISTDTITIVKNNWPNASPYSGARYGDYYFVCNGSALIHRISQTLNYDAQTVNYTLGAILTGAISGATAIILQDADAGVTGTLTLGNISGTFQDNELITDSSGGSATANGVIGFTVTSVAGSPKAKVLRAIGARLFAGNLSTDTSAVAYSAVDIATNPPFTNWVVGPLADDPGLVNFRNAGTVNAIESLGNNIVVFSDFGKWAFYINTQTVGAAINKIDVFVISRLDFGGARGAITTPKGLFYVNSTGLWQLTSIGQANIPFSDQEGITSVLLGNTYFDNVELSNISIVYDGQVNTLYVACAKDSEVNNLVLAYNIENKAFTEIRGWNINRFLGYKGTIFGAGSNKTKVWTCFSGFSDDGVDIFTEYYQEIKTGDLETRQILLGEYVQGFLSQGTELLVRFDIYDVDGNLKTDKLKFLWTAQGAPNNQLNGWGQAGWGQAGWGGDVDSAGLVESFDGAREYIRNYQRIRVHITGHDKLPHSITWIKLLTKSKIQIRRRKLEKVS